jgi:hypothetical protein
LGPAEGSSTWLLARSPAVDAAMAELAGQCRLAHLPNITIRLPQEEAADHTISVVLCSFRAFVGVQSVKLCHFDSIEASERAAHSRAAPPAAISVHVGRTRVGSNAQVCCVPPLPPGHASSVGRCRWPSSSR